MGNTNTQHNQPTSMMFVPQRSFACYTRLRACRPMYTAWEPTTCSPSSCCSPSLLLLMIVLAFPCLVKMIFGLLATGVLIAFGALAFGLLINCVSSFIGDWCPCSPGTDSKTACEKRAMRVPSMDHTSVTVTADSSALKIAVSAPGVATQDLDVKLQPGECSVLTIKGESTKAGIRRSVHRSIVLPKNVDVDAACAVHADGLLTITLPRKVVPPMQIKIKPAQPPASTPARWC